MLIQTLIFEVAVCVSGEEGAQNVLIVDHIGNKQGNNQVQGAWKQEQLKPGLCIYINGLGMSS